VLKEKSAYIDAIGRHYPCCWLGNQKTDYISNISEVEPTWKTDNPHPVCKSTCSTNVNTSTSNFNNQWHKEVSL